MALRDQPYLPLYVQDFLTDEKLMECSASATGIYIRLLCVMHKSEEYGVILLKQKDKQTDNQINNFALKVAKHVPYGFDVVSAAISELIDEKCLEIDGDSLLQKRMVYDAELSLKRSESGSIGGKNSRKKDQNFAQAKTQANTEVEYEYISKIISDIQELNKEELKETEKPIFMFLIVEMAKAFKSKNPEYPFNQEADYHACLKIAYHIAEMKEWSKHDVVNGRMNDCLSSWHIIIDFIKTDEWLKTRSLTDIGTVKEWQRLVMKMKANKPKAKRNIVV